VLSILGFWLLRYILQGLSFVENLFISGSSISAADIINVLAYLAIIALLLAYAWDFGNWKPGTFSSYPALGTLLTALVYVGVLSAVFARLRPMLVEFAPEPVLILIFQVVLAILALTIVIRAAFIDRFGLAGWLTKLIASIRVSTMKESLNAYTSTITTKTD
jgi:hypothetical protein